MKKALDYLSQQDISDLQDDGWILGSIPSVDDWEAEARAAGWLAFPLVVDFLNLFNGFSTETEEEIYIGAWKAIPLHTDNHDNLRRLREEEALFPIGLAAGWVNILLRDDGMVFLSINGKVVLYGQLGHLISNILATRKIQDET